MEENLDGQFIINMDWSASHMRLGLIFKSNYIGFWDHSISPKISIYWSCQTQEYSDE